MTETLNSKRSFPMLTLKGGILIILFLIACIGFGTIAHEMVIEEENDFDHWVFDQLSPFKNATITSVMKTITFLGSRYFLFPAYVVLVLFYWKTNRRYSLSIAALGFLSTGVMLLLKYLFGRVRPNDPLVMKVVGFSFPSGHSFSSFIFFGILAFTIANTTIHNLYKWIFGLLFFTLALLVAFSRVYLQVHYASDVIGGFLLAIIWVVVSFVILKRTGQFETKR